MSELYVLKYVSPIGEIEIQGTNEAVYSIMFSNRNELLTRAIEEVPIQVLAECAIQLDEYFKGERFEFTFPYAFEGTDFQQKYGMLWCPWGTVKRQLIKILLLLLEMKKRSEP